MVVALLVFIYLGHQIRSSVAEIEFLKVTLNLRIIVLLQDSFAVVINLYFSGHQLFYSKDSPTIGTKSVFALNRNSQGTSSGDI